MIVPGKLEEAKKLLREAIAVLEKSPTAASDYCKVYTFYMYMYIQCIYTCIYSVYIYIHLRTCKYMFCVHVRCTCKCTCACTYIWFDFSLCYGLKMIYALSLGFAGRSEKEFDWNKVTR